MALSMKLASVFSARSRTCYVNVKNTPAGVCSAYETCFSRASYFSRPHDLYRYVPCCTFSQPASNTPASEPTKKPGLIKRMALKSDEVFCKVLGRISPWMLQEYGHLKIGFVQFFGDAKSVYYINKRIRKEKLQLTDLHWKDLHLKKQMPNDMSKMVPTVILLSLPFVYYFVLPLVFIYPTVFLSNQFLSRDKLLRYYLKSYQQRAALYPTILELLSQKASRNPSKADKYTMWKMLDTQKAEQQVSAQHVLQARKAFHAYRFRKLPRKHLKCLCKLCSLRTMCMPAFLLRRKLNKNMALMQAMDLSIKKEGVSTLDHLELETGSKFQPLCTAVCYKLPKSYSKLAIHACCWMNAGEMLVLGPFVEAGLYITFTYPYTIESCLITSYELFKLCYERGLNVVHSDKRELQAWLGQWLEFSSKTNDDDRSFIAHSTALLVIGHPSCRRLQDIPDPTPPKKEESKKA